MRFVMKSILNSLWGKLCQKFNKSFVYFVNDSEELCSHVYNKKYDTVYFDVLDSQMAHIVCNRREEYNHKINKISPKSILYYDTNSIIYYSKHCDEILELKSDLGCMTSELKDGEYITSFVSTGPKNYSFTTNYGVEVTHVKGFKLKTSKNQIISPDFLYEMLDDFDKTFTIETEN